MRPLQDRIRGLLDRSPEGGIFLPVVSTTGLELGESSSPEGETWALLQTD